MAQCMFIALTHVWQLVKHWQPALSWGSSMWNIVSLSCIAKIELDLHGPMWGSAVPPSKHTQNFLNIHWTPTVQQIGWMVQYNVLPMSTWLEAVICSLCVMCLLAEDVAVDENSAHLLYITCLPVLSIVWARPLKSPKKWPPRESIFSFWHAMTYCTMLHSASMDTGKEHWHTLCKHVTISFLNVRPSYTFLCAARCISAEIPLHMCAVINCVANAVNTTAQWKRMKTENSKYMHLCCGLSFISLFSFFFAVMTTANYWSIKLPGVFTRWNLHDFNVTVMSVQICHQIRASEFGLVRFLCTYFFLSLSTSPYQFLYALFQGG